MSECACMKERSWRTHGRFVHTAHDRRDKDIISQGKRTSTSSSSSTGRHVLSSAALLLVLRKRNAFNFSWSASGTVHMMDVVFCCGGLDVSQRIPIPGGHTHTRTHRDTHIDDTTEWDVNLMNTQRNVANENLPFWEKSKTPTGKSTEIIVSVR